MKKFLGIDEEGEEDKKRLGRVWERKEEEKQEEEEEEGC